MTLSEAARRRTLEDENRRLKKLLADSMLDVPALKDLLGKTTRSADRYVAVEELMADHGFFQASRLQAARVQPVGMVI